MWNTINHDMELLCRLFRYSLRTSDNGTTTWSWILSHISIKESVCCSLICCTHQWTLGTDRRTRRRGISKERFEEASDDGEFKYSSALNFSTVVLGPENRSGSESSTRNLGDENWVNKSKDTHPSVGTALPCPTLPQCSIGCDARARPGGQSSVTTRPALGRSSS